MDCFTAPRLLIRIRRMMENFLFLDDMGDPIRSLTYSCSASWGGPQPYHKSINGFATVMGLAAIQVDYIGVDETERNRLLRSIRSIREEHSGAVATREQIIEAEKAN